MQTPEISIRDVKPADYAGIRRIHQFTFDEHVAREPEFDSDAPFIDQYLNDQSADPFNLSRLTIRVAIVNNTIAGYVIYKTIKLWGLPATSFILDISVSPAFRRAGIGRALLNDLATREPRSKTLVANIWPENTASQTLFKSMGYDLHPDQIYPFLNAYKSQKIAFRHQPLTLLTPLGVWLYAHALYLAETVLIRIGQPTEPEAKA